MKNTTTFVIREWSGRCLFKNNFSPTTGLSADESQAFGAPILVSESNSDSNLNSFKEWEAIFSLCALLKSHSYPPYAIERPQQHNCVAQSILFSTRDEINDFRLTEEQEATGTAIADFFKKSEKLEKHFS